MISSRPDAADREADRWTSRPHSRIGQPDPIFERDRIVAGIIRMAWPRFLAFNALGAVLWVGVWALIGYLAGNHITAITTGSAATRCTC